MKNNAKALIQWTVLGLVSATAILTGFSKNLFSTQNPMTLKDYTKEWKQIDSLENKGMLRSALEKVDALYTRAKQDKESAQLLKTLIYRCKYLSNLEENGEILAINRLREEMNGADFPEKPILQSMLGQLYQKYQDENFWRFSNRTTIADYKPADLATWSAEQIQDESAKFYLASVTDARLRTTPLKDFDPILLPGVNTTSLRPNLFDVLAHRAIGHFANSRSRTATPAYKFYIDNPAAFADAATFVTANFPSQDENSYERRALLLYQEVLKAHLNDASPDALIDADLLRLDFVNEKSTLPNKAELYLAALENFSKKYPTHPAAASAIYRIAQHYTQRGRQYNANDKSTEKYRLDLKKAKAICEECIKKFPKATGAQQCKNLIASLSNRSVNLQLEEVSSPKNPVLIQVGFRNTNRTFLRLVQLSPEMRERHRKLRQDEADAFLRKIRPLRKWTATLPDDGDLQEHFTEIKTEGLELGFYALMAADDEAMGNKERRPAVAFFHVSNFGILNRNDDTGALNLVVVNRQTGEPIPGVEATFFSNEYNRSSRTYEDIELGRSKTDADGFVSTNIRDRSIRVRFTQGKDLLYLNDSYYSYSRDLREDVTQNTYFFLDRAIYRPGQTIYFKGIALENRPNEKPVILANTKVTVTFFDANQQEIERKELVTNAYGSFNGTFVAPAGGLRGRMSLISSIGAASTSFNVEEYKRPTFEVALKPLEGEAKLDQQITVKGEAKAFAGNNITGAKVTYRVVRQTRIPWWMLWRWGGYWPGNSEEQEITLGETQTDEQGQFSINFQAIPDRDVAPADKPEFQFTVYADVVDITGETHSSERSVTIGYVGLSVEVDLAKQMNQLETQYLGIRTQNLDGQFQAASGRVKIYRLQAPAQPYQNRLWEAPDRPSIAEKDFRAAFPNLPFGKEDLPENWTKQDVVFDQNFNTAENDSLELPMMNLRAGHYAVELSTQDAKGEKIEFSKYFQTYNSVSKQIPASTILMREWDQSSFEPEEMADLMLYSGLPNLKILIETEKNNRIRDRKWISLQKWAEESYLVKEADRGNVQYLLAYVWNGRAYSDHLTLNVPWSNQELKVEYQSFRDKLKPGQDEEWRLRISGPKGEQVAAEMVAALYDESLDQFAANAWYMWPFASQTYSAYRWNNQAFGAASANYYIGSQQGEVAGKIYPVLNWFGYTYDGDAYQLTAGSRPRMAQMRSAPAGAVMDIAMQEEATLAAPPAAEAKIANYGSIQKDEEVLSDAPDAKPAAKSNPPDFQPRTNLKETVFFMPELATDASGAILIKFKMNEALTRWKFLGLAHTKDLKIGSTTRSVLTQKELMVQPNAPRFLREGDEIEFTAKVSNLSGQALTGTASLQLFDAVNGKAVDLPLANTNATQPFNVAIGQAAPLSWKLKIPVGGPSAVTYRVMASAASFSDGEENALPVLSNRMLVTETLPLFVRSKQSKNFSMASMAEGFKSSTLQPHQFTLEFTSNPAWLAVKALPYLMEYPHDCSEQIFSRYYANNLAAHVANQHPKIRQVFDKWKNSPTALQSNLRANQELKAVLLEETPWVLEAQSEEKQRQQIAILFDLDRMANEEVAALGKLRERQMADGGWSWFPGGTGSWYITQHIAAGFGHLAKLGVKPKLATEEMALKAIEYCDTQIAKAYEELKKAEREKRLKLSDDNLWDMYIHYLYTRSFYPKAQGDKAALEARNYFLQQAKTYWNKKGNYQQGMLALALQRFEDKSTPAQIVKSLGERAIRSEELGMYWKSPAGYYWYEAPIETQALMIELFAEVGKDEKAVDELKVWLLRNKQTTHWKTTKATSEAIYALLVTQGKVEMLADAQQVKIDFKQLKGKETIATISKAQQDAEPGTGYFKTSWKGNDIRPGMEQVSVNNPNSGIAWGAIYWQYFEQLDKIKAFEATPLTLRKKLFKEEKTATGPKLREISANEPLRPGDKIIVRVELRSDRDMEYIHLKDMRASGFEPMNVLSQYKYKDGLGYYESTGDAATHFFIDYLRKGTYVFEYPLRVVHKGTFSNGISSIQCMYAPEFSSFSSGERVEVK
jgi:hypothetical protein